MQSERTWRRRGATSFHLFLIAGCLFVWGFVIILMCAMGSVKGDEVGILVNNLTGEVTLYENPGTYIYNAITSDMHLLDKKEQTIEMTADPNRGDKRGADFVRVKTRDGSDVNVDVTINYRLIPSEALKIIQESGPGDAYKKKWVRAYSRSICRNELGKLKTEEFYKSSLRTQKANSAKKLLNEHLRPHGVEITTVQVQSFKFYDEYEAKIREKKLADQEVEEQKSQADASREMMKRRIIEREKSKEVEIAKYVGTLKKQLLEAQAEAEKAKKASDAYYYKTTQNAEAELYRRKREAEAILAEKKAEATGVRKLCNALAGEGGRNMVLLEYAKKLNKMTLMGQPYTLDSSVGKVQHLGFVPARNKGGGR